MDIHAVRKRIRVRREDSAFVYFVLEAHEGVTSYSTLEYRPEDLHRDLELLYSPEFAGDVERILRGLSRMIYPLPGTEVAPGA